MHDSPEDPSRRCAIGGPVLWTVVFLSFPLPSKISKTKCPVQTASRVQPTMAPLGPHRSPPRRQHIHRQPSFRPKHLKINSHLHNQRIRIQPLQQPPPRRLLRPPNQFPRLRHRYYPRRRCSTIHSLTHGDCHFTSTMVEHLESD
jgi:hypothetical protein